MYQRSSQLQYVINTSAGKHGEVVPCWSMFQYEHVRIKTIMDTGSDCWELL